MFLVAPGMLGKGVPFRSLDMAAEKNSCLNYTGKCPASIGTFFFDKLRKKPYLVWLLNAAFIT